MKKIVFPTILILINTILFAQVAINITSVSSNTPSNDDIYIAGNFNNWNPNNSSYKLTKSGNSYSIILPSGTGEATYKFTRGSWATVEGDAVGNVIQNRTFTYSSNTIINVSILGWEDKKTGGGNNSTALPNVKLLSNNFYMPQLNKNRRIWIYLPNDYETNLNKKYPVLYMHDGQNCFDKTTAFAGEWGVDETLNNKEKNGDKGCIVVAIDNGGASRLDEYSPYVNSQYGGGKGDDYLDFLALTLKPFIDSAYRTFPDKNNTAMAGSSMGGLITMYALFKYPNIYGKAGIFSPTFWFSNQLYTYVLNKSKSNNQKFYFVCGQNEAGNMANWQDSMNAVLQSKGYDKTTELKNLKKPEGTHSESFWNAEFGACYDWLFADLKQNVKKNEKLNDDIIVYPNPAKNTLFISSLLSKIESVYLCDFSGKLVEFENIENLQGNQFQINIHQLNQGSYLVKVKTDKGYFTKRVTFYN
ncbi:MAG: T9SS type A sorting domain-containing protein [Bacteroidia bacterium]|nr:T9SS type A sorting domain-containing protein [Bacteroidia bacterium]